VTDHTVGTCEEWLAAREQLVVGEKEHTRLGDDIAPQRGELSRVRVERQYDQIRHGSRREVFVVHGRSQLLVYHFMLGANYEASCMTCWSVADGFDGAIPHLRARDATMTCVSTAPIEKLASCKRRMGMEL
jgi:predicted dithiol-disulfide oxidoreductase (DUF899 family)